MVLHDESTLDSCAPSQHCHTHDAPHTRACYGALLRSSCRVCGEFAGCHSSTRVVCVCRISMMNKRLSMQELCCRVLDTEEVHEAQAASSALPSSRQPVALRMLASCRYHVSRHFRPTALLEVPLRPLSADNVGRARRRHDGQLEG